MTHVTNRRELCRSITSSVTTNRPFCWGFVLLRQYYEVVIPRVSVAETRGICSSPRSKKVVYSGHLRQMRQSLAHLFFRILVVDEFVRKVLFIGRHVEI